VGWRIYVLPCHSMFFHASVNSRTKFTILTIYEGRSINKLQNGAIPLILKTGKIRNIHFVRNSILNIKRNFLDDDVIIVTSSVHRTQPIGI